MPGIQIWMPVIIYSSFSLYIATIALASSLISFLKDSGFSTSTVLPNERIRCRSSYEGRTRNAKRANPSYLLVNSIWEWCRGKERR